MSSEDLNKLFVFTLFLVVEQRVAAMDVKSDDVPAEETPNEDDGQIFV